MAEKAIEGILTDREIVMLPWWTKFLFVLKALLPSEGYASLAKAMGLNSAMDEFIGRKKAK